MAQLIDQAADGVWLVTGTDVNWVLVTDADEVTLVDTGEPRDWPRVRSSLQRIGRAVGDASDQLLLHAAKEMQRTWFERMLGLVSVDPLDFREHRRVDKVHERAEQPFVPAVRGSGHEQRPGCVSRDHLPDTVILNSRGGKPVRLIEHDRIPAGTVWPDGFPYGMVDCRQFQRGDPDIMLGG